MGEVVASDALGVAARDGWPRARRSTSFSAIRPMMLRARIAQPLTELVPRVAAPEALIVIESSKRNPLALDLPLTDERTYGDTRIAIHRGR